MLNVEVVAAQLECMNIMSETTLSGSEAIEYVKARLSLYEKG